MFKFDLTNNYHKVILIIFILLKIYYKSMQKLSCIEYTCTRSSVARRLLRMRMC